MDHIKQLIGPDLKMVQPTLGRRYELVAEGKVFGTLFFESILSSLGTVECSEGSFTFKRQGFLRPIIMIRRTGSDLEHGRMVKDGRHQGGVVHLQGGGKYQLVKMGVLHPEWSVLDGSGRPLVRTQVKWGLRYQAEVHIEPFGKDDKNLVLLLMVGLYAIIIMNDDTNAAAAAST